MEQFKPKDQNYRSKVKKSFNRQGIMRTINASISKIEPGKVEIELKYSPEITQQHGFVHAGIVSTVLDSACGHAAMSLVPKDAGVLTIEFKVTNYVNLVAEAIGIKRDDKFKIYTQWGDLDCIIRDADKHNSL